MAKRNPPIVLVDTREQLPFKFPSDWTVVPRKLDTGDYSIVGAEEIFAVERKSINDLLGCIFTDRFEREMERAAAIDWFFLVIEGSPSPMTDGFSKVNPLAVLGKLQALVLDYGFHIHWAGSRSAAQDWTIRLMEKVAYRVEKMAAAAAVAQTVIEVKNYGI